jgi:hypothetical protein
MYRKQKLCANSGAKITLLSLSLCIALAYQSHEHVFGQQQHFFHWTELTSHSMILKKQKIPILRYVTANTYTRTDVGTSEFNSAVGLLPCFL